MKEHYSHEHEARWNNIGELISVARKTPVDDGYVDASSLSDEEHNEQSQSQPIVLSDSEEESESDDIVEFLEYCALCSNQKELEEGEGGVREALHK